MAELVARTTCNRDCPDACGLLVTVRDGEVVKIAGDPEHPITKGFLCFRTSRFLELANSPARLTQPLVRRGDALQPATWDEALDVIARQLLQVRDESGPAAIFHYRSGGSLGILKHLTDLFFDQFGPCTGKVGDICSGAGEAAQLEDFGVSDSNDVFDLYNSKHIVAWGKNPTVSSVHLVPILKHARERGARLWSIDPVHHKTHNLADEVLRPVPGGDFELAMGVARVLFDEGLVDARAAEFCDGLDGFRRLAETHDVAAWAQAAGVTEAEVRALAACFADGPTAILVGWGLQRRQRGGATVRALDALCAISGNLFCPGGGVSFYFARRKPFQAFGPPVQHPRTIREPLLGEDLLAAKDPTVRFLWITAGNPVAMLPDSPTVARAIEQTEFVVVADCLMTDTARRADVVLPIPTLLEDSDLLGAYGHHWIAESRSAVPPPPGVRHEIEVFQALAKRIGLESYPTDSIDQLKRRALASIAGQGASLESLRHGGAIKSPLAEPQLFRDRRVHTKNGKVQLLQSLPSAVAVEAPPELPGGTAPLWLFSNSSEKSQASQWVGVAAGERPWCVVHPDRAAGIADGALVRVVSRHGEIQAVLRHDPEQRRDVVIVPKGGHFDRGHSANTLIAARATDIGLGAAYLDCLVRIAPV